MKFRYYKRLMEISALILPLLLSYCRAAPEEGALVKNAFVPFSQIVKEATLKNPQKVGSITEKTADPFWTDKGLFLSRDEALFGLTKAEKKGAAVYDLSSGAFYASVNGCIVRLEEDGGMTVILDDVQGIDIDVRAAKGLALSREPDDRIILYKWKGSEVERKTLFSGEQFFYPRFSADGSMILISESSPDGGRFHLYSLQGAVLELGKVFIGHGYGASWLHDGRGIIFSRIEHDGYRIISSELWLYDLEKRSEIKITDTAKTAEIEPSVSLDGKWLSFVDAHTDNVFVARFLREGANIYD